MKVVGVGLNKTGTTTLGVCLRTLGFKHISFDPAAFRLFRANDQGAVMKMVEGLESFESWPWGLLYREIDRAYPGSKFILTTRKSSETWYDSLCRHADRTGPTEYRERVYGHAMPHDHRAEHIDFYRRYNDLVRAYFADRRDQLLEVCWENGDGWPELSRFLGQPCPDLPLPHANKSRHPYVESRARLKQMALSRVVRGRGGKRGADRI